MASLKKKLKAQRKLQDGNSKSDVSDKSKGTDLSLISRLHEKIIEDRNLAEDRNKNKAPKSTNNVQDKAEYDEEMFGSKNVEVDAEDAKEGSRGSFESNNKSVHSRID